VVSLDGYAELFVRSLHLDLEDLFEEPLEVQYPEFRRSSTQDSQSVVGVMEKGDLLSFVDELELSEAELSQQVQELAHDEPIGEWVGLIREFLLKRPGEGISFVALQRSLGIPWICLWLGLLHGGENWQLRQSGEFYNPHHIEVRAVLIK
jgi:hypothetical protein